MAVLTKITSRSLADNAVSSAKIQDGAIAVADVADGSISTAKLADDAVTTAKIANDQVTAAKIPAGAVVADVGAGGITDTQLATNAVTTVKIAADAVTNDKVADAAIDTAAKLGSNVVTSSAILDANITAAKLSSTALATVENVKPHIQPGKLYPAWSGLLTDNTGFTFTDSSTSARILSPSGAVHHSGVQKKIGSTALAFSGVSGGGIVTVPASTDFDLFDTYDWTLELWLYHRSPTTNWGRIMGKDSDNNGWEMHFNGTTGQLQFGHGSTGFVSGDMQSNSNSTIAANTWTHIAVVHTDSSNNFRMYKDGVMVIEQTGVVNDWTSANKAIRIGDRYNNAYWMDGYLDEIRLVKGTAVYTGNFTPPTALTATGGTYASGTNVNTSITSGHTKLLIHSDAGGHVGAYGTAQADGHKYYYTDIKGSEPIHDPRIGAYFGGQRHPFRSLQLLEKETEAQSVNCYSVDGRKWIRISGTANTDVEVKNHGSGNMIKLGNGTDFIEITGYLNDINIRLETHPNYDGWTKQLNGGTVSAGQSAVTRDSPLTNRFMDSGSVLNVGVGATLGINTVRINSHDNNIYCFGIDLVAHDKFTDATCDTNHTSGLGSPASTSKITMTSTAALSVGISVSGAGIAAGTTVSSIESSTVAVLSAATTATNTNATLTFGGNDISIPAQNVVSYGKKFALSAASHHYNPFATNQAGAAVAIGSGSSHGSVATGWAGTGAGYYDNTLDTATSMGLSAWVQNSKYYRPVNGGRVVKWVDSSGNIKTSVNMMPPAACITGNNNGGQSTLVESYNWTTQITPVFGHYTIDSSQSETAKTFSIFEFGNGSCNSGTTAGLMKSDFSMLSDTPDECVYVMDDGLTGAHAKAWRSYENQSTGGGGRFTYGNSPGSSLINYTFIGTGFSTHAIYTSSIPIGWRKIVENLPYGTHVIKVHRNGTPNTDVWVDGVHTYVNSTDHNLWRPNEIAYSQPKRPPIPEDAVVLSDYMLMADFIGQSTGGNQHISKGSRYISSSRDIFYDSGGTVAMGGGPDALNYRNQNIDIASHSSMTTSLPAFGTQFAVTGYAMNADLGAAMTMEINNSAVSSTTFGSAAVAGGFSPTTTLGHHKFELSGASSGSMNLDGFYIASPIHTSHHYQTFETPFLKELVGGDRNMEQNNLVVTGDGKSWDEVTRDTSYIGNTVFGVTNVADGNITGNIIINLNDYRGAASANSTWNAVQKDVAIGFDRWYILEDGQYECRAFYRAAATNTGWRLLVNAIAFNDQHHFYHNITANSQSTQVSFPILTLKRGDFIFLLMEGGNIGPGNYEAGMKFEILKLKK